MGARRVNGLVFAAYAVVFAVSAFAGRMARAAETAPTAESSRLTCVAGGGPARATLVTRDGRSLVARDGELQVDDRRLTVCDGLPGAFPTALAESPVDGAIYVGFRREGVWKWDAAGFTVVAGLPDSARSGGVRALAADGPDLWVATGTAGLWHTSPDRAFAPVAHKVLGQQGIFALHTSAGAEKSRGVDVAVGPYGAYRVQARGEGGVAVSRLAGGFVGCFDAAGRPAVYCAPTTPAARTTAASQAALAARPLQTPPTTHFTSVASLHGVLYAGSFDQGLFASADGLRFEAVEGLPPFVNTLAVAGETLLIGTARGLYVLDATGGTARAVPGITAHVNALAVGPAQAVAVGTAQGVYVLEGGAVRHLGESDGLPGRQCWALAWGAGTAGAPVLWVGTADGLARFDGGAHVEVFTQAGGHLPHDWVTALLPDGEGMLVGTYDAGVVALVPDAAAPQGLRREVRLAAAWVNPMGLTRVAGAVVVSTLGEGAGPLGRGGFRSVLPAALDDVTAVAVHRSAGGVGGATAGPSHVWFATRGGLVHAPEGWYRLAHDAEQACGDSPCVRGVPDRRLAGGVRLERGR